HLDTSTPRHLDTSTPRHLGIRIKRLFILMLCFMPALVFSQIYSFQSYFISGVSVLPEGTYANCTFTCTSGSVIRLKAELYSFYSCTFESYSGPDLWEGIYVPNQGSIKTEGTNEATIPTSHLANGLYLVIISQGGSNTVKTWAKSTR
ncbi:MAG TPA: hypothetical protein PKA71_01180, partial [Saprospiraceae bacterium]|nr:hypothetical protein [Saprospiraceae bacterium]HMX82564.1 hypothetical protein [Saprospiraceae bacterium]